MSQPKNRIRDHLQIVLASDDALEIDNAALEALLDNTDGEPFTEDEVRRILVKVSEVGLIHSRSNNDGIVKTTESVTQKADPMISNPNRTQTDSQRSLVPPRQPLATRRSVGSTSILVVVALSLVVVLGILTTNGPRPVNESQSVFTFQVPQPGSSNESKIAALNGRRQSIGFAGLIPRPRPESPAVQRIAVGDHVRTTDRERRRLSLPDGSVLYVNENTSLRIHNERQIALSAGEVFVEVVPASLRDDHAPFVVQTPKRTVTALGTKFAVEAAPNHTEVLVTQGKVQVSGLIKPLIGGQEVRIEDQLPAASPAPSRRASQVLSWTKDLMAAADSPLVPGSDYDGGALVVVDPAGQEQKLEMRKFHVDVHIEDGFARTTIDQTYFNTQWSRLEGTFYFPLPPDASLSRLAMYVGGNLMEGGMDERDHARNVFEQIMYTKRDPALLEWVDGSTFKMRVFPLEPRQEKRILLSYTQRLRGRL